MPDTTTAARLSDTERVSRCALAAAYHERTKHRLERYANGPETLDWDAQPDPFRRYRGAPLTPLPLLTQEPATPWTALGTPGAAPAQAFGLDSLGAFFELSLALAAWKQAGPDRWSVRINPSSGNLHPTEGWLLCQGVAGLPDGVHHYAPHEHALELRAARPADAGDATPRVFVALSSIAWREAWKYGERALRYCLLDAGHAAGALAYAAALQGWALQPRPVAAHELAAWLGLDRDGDFPGGAEREEPELLFELCPPGQSPAPLPGLWPHQPLWHGHANRLDAHPMYRWPVIDQALAATRPTEAPATAENSVRPLRPPSPVTLGDPRHAATLIRRRRSAQRFDAQARLDASALWPLLQALLPGQLPFSALPVADHVHLLLFAHRVDGLAPGAYLLPRSEGGATLLRRQLPVSMDWAPVPDAPAELPLWRLAANPALAGTLRTLNCHQALGSDAVLGFALLAEFQPLPTPWAYRERLMEAGLLGQVLYLQAEAMGLAGTGIGCFFDDALHQLIGLTPTAAAQAPLQSVYHFTIGRPLVDARIATTAPYAHLPARPQRLADAADRSTP
ncbi:nitroreductase [Ideonella sp. B7]|uniref:nitroreductase family protein n=1 Tax=Ideonella benzenivorans TaxID=2831643 RepID=UPI001CECE057|nr:nitroreductase family protein [Ideonella benzenivorans]MCA6218668.1 nitroreductase [Ideonella benzenivorans]